jgi:hypothetical protein
MASVVLTGDTSGQVTIAAPAVAGTNTATLPAATGELSMLGTTTQTWQTFTVGTQRISGTTYTNSTGKPIFISITTGGAGTSVCVVDGVTVISQAGSLQAQNSFIVSNNSTYSCTNASIQFWKELR